MTHELLETELSGEIEVLGKSCPKARLSAKNHSDLELTQGRHGDQQATKRLNYGPA
jgi:hypothetical protein